jgi:uncharacterized protein
MLTTSSPSDRALVLDALRGFAVLGILLANMQHFSGWYFLSDAAQTALGRADASRTIEFALAWFIDGKFYSLFALLFGIGFAVLLARAERDGRDFHAFFKRRLWILLGIGLVHAYLIWYGDILFLYALLGFSLLKFYPKRDGLLVLWILLLFTAPMAQYFLIYAAFGDAAPPAPNPQRDALVAGAIRSFATGSWSEVTTTNIAGVIFGRYPDLVFTGRPFKVLATFLIGLWIGRRRIWDDIDGHSDLLRRTAAWGIGVGLPLNFVLAMLMRSDAYYTLQPLGLLQSVVSTVGVPALALGYAAGFALLWLHRPWQRVLGVFAPIGRMALTSYVSHSIIGAIIFYGWGLGHFAAMDLATATTLALAIFAAQLVFSAAWLWAFRYGPLEWLWRSLTWRQRQPMRRSAGKSAAGISLPADC